MDAAEPEADATPDETPPRRRSRRGIVLAVVGLLVVGVLGVGGWWWTLGAQPDIAYDGPAETVAPGGTVTVRDPDGTCGPLVVSLHREGALGLWSQTHSGNVIDGFSRDERPWWRLRGGTYMTPVPCATGGVITFDLPEDVSAGVIAACDQDDRCARVRVAG